MASDRQFDKTLNRVLSLLIIAVTIGGIAVMGVMLDKTFILSNVTIGRKQGQGGVVGQGGISQQFPGVAPAEPASPTPTPDNKLPWLEGFNTGMDLRKISVWWGEDTAGGKSSGDAFLRTAFLPMCRLIEEVDFTPAPELMPMNFALAYDQDKTQNITVYNDDIASFPELPDRYFKVPNIVAVGYALLPSDKLPSTARGRMEEAPMLGYFSTDNTRVELRQNIIREVAGNFFDIEKTEISKPEKLSPQRNSLVFYISSVKYYVNYYDGVLNYYGQGVPDTWYSVADADVGGMLGPLR